MFGAWENSALAFERGHRHAGRVGVPAHPAARGITAEKREVPGQQAPVRAAAPAAWRRPRRRLLPG